MPVDLFVYGTLLFPEILDELLGRSPLSYEWAVRGWRRVVLKDRDFPGLVRSHADDMTLGQVLVDLTCVEFDALRRYEGPMYELMEIGHGFSGHKVFAYVCTDSGLTDGRPEWEVDDFPAEKMVEYIDQIRYWKANFIRDNG